MLSKNPSCPSLFYRLEFILPKFYPFPVCLFIEHIILSIIVFWGDKKRIWKSALVFHLSSGRFWKGICSINFLLCPARWYKFAPVAYSSAKWDLAKIQRGRWNVPGSSEAYFQVADKQRDMCIPLLCSIHLDDLRPDSLLTFLSHRKGWQNLPSWNQLRLYY